ncbi:hypothetical protein [Acidovorax sp. BLS4]|uniref:hypothetical protein n=1 Tax=Acidovorax sp. BLS4 TaxID=3273430 RepID=UPI0029421D70|nr:hypothetical protein [Paracidovorax avenae]WOI43760.1 hypothetical protein R1Z03_14565 [Paracidovorax avenae]
MSTITIHVIDQPDGSVSIITTAGMPVVGVPLTPAGSLALDLLTVSARRANPVRYWAGEDKALQLVHDLLTPEQYGYAVPFEVHEAARGVLGIPRLGRPQPQGTAQ